jgi:hypothetical protein
LPLVGYTRVSGSVYSGFAAKWPLVRCVSALLFEQTHVSAENWLWPVEGAVLDVRKFDKARVRGRRVTTHHHQASRRAAECRRENSSTRSLSKPLPLGLVKLDRDSLMKTPNSQMTGFIISRRWNARNRPKNNYTHASLLKHARHARSAGLWAVTHQGVSVKVVCYAKR